MDWQDQDFWTAASAQLILDRPAGRHVRTFGSHLSILTSRQV
jgi:hypothetical protein